MKLSDLQAIQQETTRKVAEQAESLGVLTSYPQDLHIRVHYLDFEQLITENAPVKQWTNSGNKPNKQTRFAYFGGWRDRVSISAEFDYSKE